MITIVIYEVWTGIVLPLMLPISITTVPSLIAAKYTFFLARNYWRTDNRGKKTKFEYVMSSFIGAMTCLAVLGIVLIIEQVIGPPTQPARRFLGEYYHLMHRALIVGFSLWVVVCFYFVVNNVVSNPMLRNIVRGYIVVYVLLKYMPGLPHSPVKILSYGYNRLADVFFHGSFALNVKDGGLFWPEMTLEFGFFFLIIFITLRYTANLLTYIQARNSSGEGPFDLEAIVIAVDAFIWIISALLAFGMLRLDLGGLGLTTGLIAAGLTISFRDLLNNFFSGILLNLDKSIKLRDVIRMSDGVIGEVKKISLRYTFLETRDNVDILVPNSVLIQNRFENLTRTQQEVRLTLRFSVGQEVDLDIVERLAGRACMYVPEVAAVTARLPALFYLGVSDSSNLFDLKFWVSDPRPGPPKLQSDVAKQLFRVFKKEGVPLPRIRYTTNNEPGREPGWPAPASAAAAALAPVKRRKPAAPKRVRQAGAGG